MINELSEELNHLIDALAEDFYHPLGPIPLEGFAADRDMTLSEAESTGLIVVKRGDGRFVTSDEETIGRIREKHVGDLADSYVSSLRSFGLSDSDVEDITRKAINSERKDLNHG